MIDDGTTEPWEDNALAWKIIAARNSAHAPAEIESDIEVVVAEKRADAVAAMQYGARGVMAYYNDPDTQSPYSIAFANDTAEDQGESSRPDSRLPAFRLAALLLGLCLAAGAAAIVAATGGGPGWAVVVFGLLAAQFVNGWAAGAGA